MTTAPVLLLTHSRDFYCVDLVKAALEARGVPAWRVNTDRFPVHEMLTFGFAGASGRWVLQTEEGTVDLLDVPAFWARRLWPGAMPAEMDRRLAPYARREARTAYLDGLSLLSRARWVNPVVPMMRAESKLLQLKLAARLGLPLPPTLITNDPDEVRRFFAEHDGRIVTKLLGALTQTMNATGDFMYTSRVKEEDLDALEGLRLCPQIFQPEVEKAAELRCVVVGDRFFVGSMETNAASRAQVDWRKLTQKDGAVWKAASLPEHLAAGLRKLMDELDLVYGAVDLIVTPEGEHVFLEVNPAGEWGWLEKDLGLPIAAALADELLVGVKGDAG